MINFIILNSQLLFIKDIIQRINGKLQSRKDICSTHGKRFTSKECRELLDNNPKEKLSKLLNGKAQFQSEILIFPKNLSFQLLFLTLSPRKTTITVHTLVVVENLANSFLLGRVNNLLYNNYLYVIIENQIILHIVLCNLLFSYTVIHL